MYTELVHWTAMKCIHCMKCINCTLNYNEIYNLYWTWTSILDYVCILNYNEIWIYIHCIHWTVMKYKIWIYTLHCIHWSVIKYLHCILYNERMKYIHCMLLTSTLNYSETYTVHWIYTRWTEWIHYIDWTRWNIYTYWTCTTIVLQWNIHIIQYIELTRNILYTLYALMKYTCVYRSLYITLNCNET